MKRILGVAVALTGLALASSAYAQEWNGFEAGIQGGYLWGESKGVMHNGAASAPYHFHPDGGAAGGHAGYLWQNGGFVFGAEGDAEWADESVKGPHAGGTFKSDLDFDASVRAKLGWAFGRALLYGTGGAAFGDISNTYTFAGTSHKSSDLRIGWTGGGGIEAALTPNWNAGVEYRYTDYGSHSFSGTFPGLAIPTVTDKNNFQDNAVRLRITYRFAPPPPMMAPPAPMPAAAPAPPPPAPPRTFLVFFDFDKYNLTADARKVVEAAAGSFKANGVARIELTGYTDLAGTQAYNLRLSKRRAETVAAALEKMGVPKSAINVMWRGKENPRVPTPDGVREPQNRRVEIVMP